MEGQNTEKVQAKMIDVDCVQKGFLHDLTAAVYLHLFWVLKLQS